VSRHDEAGRLDLNAAVECARKGQCVVCGRLTLTVYDALRHFRQSTENSEPKGTENNDPVAI